MSATMQLCEQLQELDRCLGAGVLTKAEHADTKRRVLENFAPSESRASLRVSPSPRSRSPSRSPLGERRSSAECPSSPSRLARLTKQEATATSQEVLDEQIGDADFWCKWIDARRNATDTSNRRSLDHATIRDLCDITADRMEDIFTRCDVDESRRINNVELSQALQYQGFEVDPEEAQSIICKVTSGNTINFKGFERVVQSLRLAELFTPTAGIFQFSATAAGATSSQVICYDYTEGSCDPKVLSGIESHKEWFFSHTRGCIPMTNDVFRSKGESRPIRWVHVDGTRGLDRLTLLRLAVKYHLHPLFIDEIISNKAATRIDCIGGHYFLAAEILSLAKSDCSSSEPDGPPPRVAIHRSHVSIFCAGPPTSDTLLTIHQERPDESSWMSMWRVSKTGSTYCNVNKMWEKLREKLKMEPPRRLRSEPADFLLYEIILNIIDGMPAITGAYASRLGYMHRQPVRSLTQDNLVEIAEVRLELEDLKRSARPLRLVVRHIIDDGRIGASATTYLEDVEDALDAICDDLSQLGEMSKSIEEAHERYRDKSMNDTLFALSIISAVFLPAQFITGLYGMNFDHIPELSFEYGYPYFWMVSCIASASMVVVISAVAGSCGRFRSLMNNALHWCRWRGQAKVKIHADTSP